MIATFTFPFVAIAAAFGLYCLVNYPLAVVAVGVFLFFTSRK
jgi:hypothetical protein